MKSDRTSASRKRVAQQTTYDAGRRDARCARSSLNPATTDELAAKDRHTRSHAPSDLDEWTRQSTSRRRLQQLLEHGSEVNAEVVGGGRATKLSQCRCSLSDINSTHLQCLPPAFQLRCSSRIVLHEVSCGTATSQQIRSEAQV